MIWSHILRRSVRNEAVMNIRRFAFTVLAADLFCGSAVPGQVTYERLLNAGKEPATG